MIEGGKEEVIVHPGTPPSLLGPAANVPWELVVAICEAFNRELAPAIKKHDCECHAYWAFATLEPELGTPKWVRLRAN